MIPCTWWTRGRCLPKARDVRSSTGPPGSCTVASRLLSSRADPPDDALLSKMILTNCAACAATLPHKTKQCSRCKTRYCGPACQKQHWDAAGGHKDLCKLIKKGGGAEEYHADKKYKEAVAVAAEKYADDTKGQTCFICTQALHWKTKEGLVRTVSYTHLTLPTILRV